MYKIGDKVQSPLGLGIVVEEQKDMAIGSYIIYLGKPYIKCDYNYELVFNERELKPYKTAHEKLIEMGYDSIKRNDNVFYIHDELPRVTIYNDKTYACNDTNLELSYILTQYLEEMK